jgi:hypothetical protein
MTKCPICGHEDEDGIIFVFFGRCLHTLPEEEK